MEDVLNSFYMFQCFSLTVWFISGFWMYGGALGSMLALSIYGELSTIYWNLKMLREMAHYECPISVKRKNENGEDEWKEISSSHIIPGEIFMLPEGKDMPCDAIMLKGECVINEAMLTGESAPSIKTGIPKNATEVEDFSIENKEQVN
jgi:cation-transporting P-type ATPase 13A2